MASADPAATEPHTEYAPLAAVLSYLVPGLGQIAQGRVGKGLLFLVCIYTLFFYGQYLGAATVRVDGEEYRVASNVYLPDTARRVNPFGLPRWLANLYNRPQFAGQFWVGIAAWPAIWQYRHYDENADAALRRQAFDHRADERPHDAAHLEDRIRQGDPIFGHYQRTPSEEALNAVHAGGDKLIEIAWVYTVIAGVLNIMVIYDALAGPAFAAPRRTAAAATVAETQPAAEIVGA